MYMSYAPARPADYGQSLLNLLAQAHRALELTAAISAQLQLTPATAGAPGLQELQTVLPRIGADIDTSMGAARLAVAGYNTPLVHGVMAQALNRVSGKLEDLQRALLRLREIPNVEDVTTATAAWATMIPQAVQQATNLVRAALGPENWQALVSGEAFRALAAETERKTGAAETRRAGEGIRNLLRPAEQD
jgi:hypothetical protein